MTDQKFVVNVRDVIKLEYFNSQAHKWIVQRILDYFDAFHTVPTLEVLQIEFKKIDNDVLKVAVREELKYSYEVSTDDLQFVKEEFLAFCTHTVANTFRSFFRWFWTWRSISYFR